MLTRWTRVSNSQLVWSFQVKKCLALLFGAAITVTLAGAGPASAAAGKYCVIYKGEAKSTAAALSMATSKDCRERSMQRGGDGYGLGCQIDAGEVLATDKTPNDPAEPVGATDWPTEDQKDRKSPRLTSSHQCASRMPTSA